MSGAAFDFRQGFLHLFNQAGDLKRLWQKFANADFLKKFLRLFFGAFTRYGQRRRHHSRWRSVFVNLREEEKLDHSIDDRHRKIKNQVAVFFRASSKAYSGLGHVSTSHLSRLVRDSRTSPRILTSSSTARIRLPSSPLFAGGLRGSDDGFKL